MSIEVAAAASASDALLYMRENALGAAMSPLVRASSDGSHLLDTNGNRGNYM